MSTPKYRWADCMDPFWILNQLFWSWSCHYLTNDKPVIKPDPFLTVTLPESLKMEPRETDILFVLGLNRRS